MRTVSAETIGAAVAAIVQVAGSRVDTVMTEQTLPWGWENFTSRLSNEWMSTHTVPCGALR